MRADAALIASDTLLLHSRNEIARFMAEERIVAIYPFREYAEAGGLIVHGADLAILFERAAGYVDRLLKGALVADLPVQQATEFELIVNLRTAKQIGIEIPSSLLARANEVIE